MFVRFFVCSFVRLFVCLFVCLFFFFLVAFRLFVVLLCLYVCWCYRALVRGCARLFFCTFVSVFFCPPVLPFARLLACASGRLFVYAFVRVFICSLACLFVFRARVLICVGRYLTDLNSLKINSDAEVGDIEKVRVPFRNNNVLSPLVMYQ